jgi:hypothetical protein
MKNNFRNEQTEPSAVADLGFYARVGQLKIIFLILQT